MRTVPQQTPPDGESLLRQYAAQPSAALREEIVRTYLYIAQIVARKFSGRGVDYDDLYQVASLAMLKAIDRFEPDKGVRFVSFVTPTMAGEVKNYFRDRSRAIRLPRRSAQLAAQLQKARAELTQSLGRSPRVDELALYANLSEDEVLEGLETSAAMTPSSLDRQIAEDTDETALSRFLGIADEGYADFERRDMLARALETLDARQQEIIRLRYFENLSQRDAAQRLGVSQMTISRAERQALEALRAQLNE